MLRWGLAALHLLSLAIGFTAVWTRARALKGSLDPAAIGRALTADAWWGIAALLWLATGIPRAFAGLEKGTVYYVHNHLFQAKLTAFLVVFLLEITPMLALGRWRARRRKGEAVDTGSARTIARISLVQAALLVVIVVLATGMARGFGAR